MNTPIDKLLVTGQPDFPFCLYWTNENWTRVCDGGIRHVLMIQEYNHEDDRRHIHFLFPYFQHKHYIRVEGKPLFIVYRPEFFPSIEQTNEICREEVQQVGVGQSYLCFFENVIVDTDPLSRDFNAAIEFQPRRRQLLKEKTLKDSILQRIPAKLGITKNVYATPDAYGRWFYAIVHYFTPFSVDENFIFMNAWNEWAEGSPLEPCQKWGRQYRQVTHQILEGSRA